jgi:hypothetical protein
MTSPPPPDPWPAGPVPNPSIPDPITVTCTRCEQPFVCDATSLAARDHICGPCAVSPPGAAIGDVRVRQKSETEAAATSGNSQNGHR